MSNNTIIIAIIFSTLIILLLTAGVAITVFISGKKQARLQLEYEKELRKAQQEVQEQTMAHIAGELHDNLGQLLTVTKMQLQTKDAELEKLVSPAIATISDAIQQLRLLSRSLNSDMLEEYGLLHAIHLEVGRLQHARDVKMHWHHDDTEPQLTKNQRLMVFRIFQEILNNTLKHANARNIHIELQGDKIFQLVIKDDGKGFNLDKIMHSESRQGLKNIIKRAQLSDLTYNIDTSEGKGSIFTIGLA